MGQNFLANQKISKKIAEISLGGSRGDACGAIEIGPGTGELTRELCAAYKKVVAIELDSDFGPILKETLFGLENIKIIFGDILKIDLSALVQKEFAGFDKINICANLPYYITTPIILKLVKSKADLGSITIMAQKEAADRLCIAAGEKNCTAASVALCYYGEAKKVLSVPSSDFYPQPKVSSTVVHICPRAEKIADPKNEELMYRLIEAAFGQRRKTLVNALFSELKIDKAKLAAYVAKIAGDCNIRGEELDIKAFSELSDLIFENN